MAHATTVELHLDRTTAALLAQALYSWDGWLTREQRSAEDHESDRVYAVTAMIAKQLA